ncbi:MAG: glycine betaine ABC transporter substrate-binding protein [Candidimonas sp.]|nr:MAG: glycine betaine ABC transporter substrate-binding protein [Candidimonas sp.]TAM23406.1 MAG: glycine betaine ABC transporter substrate-binding protein [Candidimonas sp.]TAM78114.1 MAG: glycine betaine ABC transporter substrate-binding protein [Candidimonas sp.]
MKVCSLITTLGLAVTLSLSALAQAAGKPEIKLGYVDGWADSVATTEVAAVIIREKLGYDVKMIPVSAGIMWSGVARGDLDASLSAWLPVTHSQYYKKFKKQIVLVGTVEPDAKIGLVVPDYVKAKTIADLKTEKAAFGGVITGIDAGAGVMEKTEKAIVAYDLGYRLLPSSGAGMAVALDRAIRAHKAIVVTGWQPHWMFGKYKLHFLSDPKKVYGASENVQVMINPKLETKAKPVVNFLRKFQWKPGQISAVMVDIQDGMAAPAAAKKWVAAHAAEVNGWVGK